MIVRNLLKRLRDEQRGVTIVEFALVAPVMCLVIVGAFDVSHTLYQKSSVTGAVQKTARDASIEGASTSELDEKVKKQVKLLVSNADVKFNRRYFKTFSEAAAKKPEDVVGDNGNNRCDKGESYIDANNNMKWDQDGGDEGQGDAKDATVYTVTIEYPRLLPLNNFIDVDDKVKFNVTTILRNQPYDAQKKYGPPTTRNC